MALPRFELGLRDILLLALLAQADAVAYFARSKSHVLTD